jgi:hypothetical protein
VTAAASPATAPTVTVGGIYRHLRHRGLWVVRRPCPGPHGAVWCLPCDETGQWNRTQGWHAFRPSEMFEPPKVRTKRAYKRKEKP